MKHKKFFSIASIIAFALALPISMNANTSYADQVAWKFNYSGQEQKFTAPYTGKYLLKVWGAEGGQAQFQVPGKGGYAEGKINLTEGQTIYIYVGGSGANGGYNGGGSAPIAATGGGATDIRTSSDGNWKDFLTYRIIVAGGGGSSEWYGGRGGDGGGLVGGDGSVGTFPDTSATYTPGKGATQSAGGIGEYANGTLGQGGTGTTDDGGGCGGGGYYGGGTPRVASGGGGGSSYIGGVLNGSTTPGLNTGNGYAIISYKSHYANGIVINKRSDDLGVGETDKLTALITPSDALVKTVKWTSSDPSIVTVDDNGNITAVKAGTAIITATVQDGRNLHGQCRVCVTN